MEDIKIKSNRGGARPGAGRKAGKKIKDDTVVFYRRVTPEEKQKLEQYLKILRSDLILK